MGGTLVVTNSYSHCVLICILSGSRWGPAHAKAVSLGFLIANMPQNTCACGGIPILTVKIIYLLVPVHILWSRMRLVNNGDRTLVWYYVTRAVSMTPNPTMCIIPRFEKICFYYFRTRTVQNSSKDSGNRTRTADVPQLQHIQSTAPTDNGRKS